MLTHSPPAVDASRVLLLPAPPAIYGLILRLKLSLFFSRSHCLLLERNLAMGPDRRNNNHNNGDVKIFTWLHANIPSVVKDGRERFLINDPRGKPWCYYGVIHSFTRTASVVPHDPEEKKSTHPLSLSFFWVPLYSAAAIL